MAISPNFALIAQDSGQLDSWTILIGQLKLIHRRVLLDPTFVLAVILPINSERKLGLAQGWGQVLSNVLKYNYKYRNFSISTSTVAVAGKYLSTSTSTFPCT